MGTNQALAKGQFKKQLAFGQIAETEIARWIIGRGGIVLPVYDIEYETGKGPRIFATEREFVAPDLLVFRNGQLTWIEAKHKTVFSWYRKKRQWETGIDAHHYREYQKVQISTKTPVWLLFFHACSIPSRIDSQHPSCPEACPVGLFGNTLDALSESARTDPRWGRYGMVYWAHSALRELAKLEEIRAFSTAPGNSEIF